MKFNMTDHVIQFANAETMRHFGSLLEEYERNTPFLNDCIFTLMHHIAGDLARPQTLFLPSILKSFTKIRRLNISGDWKDLIEFTIQKYIMEVGCFPENMMDYLTDHDDEITSEKSFVR